MKPSLEKLHKIFKLEAERGYDNHAVVGGLERMLDMWIAEARAEEVPEELIQVVISRIKSYAHLTEKSRAEALKGLWRRIQGGPAEERPVLDEREEAQPEERLSTVQEQTGWQDTRLEPPTAAPPVEPAATEPRSRPHPSGPASGAVFAGPFAALDAQVTVLDGVGPRKAQALSRLGIQTLRDMLYYFPRDYNDFSRLKPINRLAYGEAVTVVGAVQSVRNRPIRSGKMQLLEAIVSDGTGALRVTWFNQPWIARHLHPDMVVALSGKIEQYLGRAVMNNPDMEPVDQVQLSTNRIVPVYPLTANITGRWLREQMHAVVSYWGPRVQDPLPETMRRQAELVDISTALQQAHFPDSWERLKSAQQRLAFDEIFLLQTGVLRQKRDWQARSAQPFPDDPDWLEGQIARLPYALTGAQRRALQDLRQDLASGHPANRLIQGDVGSGKTAVAALAIAIVANQGAQACLMAPTSILAEQHYQSLLRTLTEAPPAAVEPEPAALEASVPFSPEQDLPIEFEEETAPLPQIEEVVEEELAAEGPAPEIAANLSQADIEAEIAPVEMAEASETVPDQHAPGPAVLTAAEIRLLIGATPEADKAEIRAGLADGSIKLVIGTHALIEDPVKFADLQLVVVDEQHRFGVAQRAALRSKGDNPHLMVMTATPIPRSLALTVYGDLDVSILDEMPPGRQPVNTYVLTQRERERAYRLIRSQVKQGGQAFIIYPLVEESEGSDARAAVEEQERLQSQVFFDLRVGLLHGRMRPDEKEAVMADFRNREFDILVSTTVIEVGVDVPNATVILIEGANRFGLAQLHQLRGRVGRSSQQSYCLLIADAPAEAENARLQVMAQTNDGFVLAERDLELRGPGQFLGTRQSGFAQLQFASLTDIRLIDKARRQAQALFEQDPELSRPEHQLLASALQRFWGGGKGDIS